MKNTATKKTETITVTATCVKNVLYADENQKFDPRTHKNTSVKIIVNATGQTISSKLTSSVYKLTRIDSKIKETRPEVYARFGDNYITEVTYNIVKDAMKEAEVGCGTTEEFDATESAESNIIEAHTMEDTKIKEETRTRQSHPGWCNKCNSYCYGDCEA